MSQFQSKGPFTCNFLLQPGVAGSKTVTWSDGASSVLAWDAAGNTQEQANGDVVLVRNGTVQSGAYKGKHFLETQTLVSTDLLGCGSEPGISTLTGVVALTII